MDGRSDPAPEFAVSLSHAFGANLFGVAFAHQPVISPDIIAGMPAGFLQALQAKSEKAARDAIARFTAALSFAQGSRTFDLAVVGQASPDDAVPQDMVVESVLLESGRPIIVVPYIQKDPVKLDRIMVCWDGGRAAARALGDALPLLLRASYIEVVTVKDADTPDEPLATGADVVQRLARHGLKARTERLIAPEVDVPDVLLSYAADSSAEFMVMGGYGHARLREIVLGGVTRGILSSMTVPVLMSH